MKKDILIFILSNIFLLCIIAAAVGISVFRVATQKEEVLTAEDVGVNAILEEKIISARFESANPNYCYEYDDTDEIKLLLETLKDAEFTVVPEYNSPIVSMEYVIVQTEKNLYCIGYIYGLDGSGGFRVGVCGQPPYICYKCSAKLEFEMKLCELQDRIWWD